MSATSGAWVLLVARSLGMAVAGPAPLAASAVDDPVAEVSSSWALGGPLQAQASIASSGLRGFVRLGAAGQTPPDTLSLGLSAPWMAVGTMDRRGLLRILENPMAFGPDSDVYQEPTGLDLSATGSASGFSVMPIPGHLGLFSLRTSGGATEFGAIAGQMPRVGAGGEVLFCVSQPPVAEGDGGWLARVQPFPGGTVAAAAGRLGVRLPRISLQTVVGASYCERAPPGFLVEVDGRLRGALGDLRGLVCYADETFFSPSGGQVPTVGRAALSLLEKNGDTTLRGSLSVDEGRLPFSPGTVIPQSVRADLDMDRVLARWPRGSLRHSLSAEKGVNWKPDGERSETARCSMAAKCQWRSLAASAALGMEEPETLAVSSFVSLGLDRAGDWVRLDLGAVMRASGAALDATVSTRRRLKDSQIQAEIGVAGLPLPPVPSALKDSLVLKLAWRTGASKVAEPDGE